LEKDWKNCSQVDALDGSVPIMVIVDINAMSGLVD
jgi:hypothetical protein